MKIHEQNEVLKKQVEVLQDGLNGLKSYLESLKFSDYPFVHKNDIFTRIAEIKDMASDFDMQMGR